MPSHNPKVRFAVAGTGGIIREFHLPALLANPRAEVIGAANLHAESLSRLTKDFKIPQTYSSFESLADDPAVDAVVIGLPNALNAPVSIQLLRAGKHVLCEKPMARSVAECEGMVEAADRSGKQLMIAHVWRANEEMRWLQGIVKSHVIGRIIKCNAFAAPANWGPPRDNWRTRRDLSGGGAFADIGIHSVDTVSFLFHDQLLPRKVFALEGNFFEKIDVEDTAQALIEYDNGMACFIEAGWYHPFATHPHGTVEIFGTKGFARVFPAELYIQTQRETGPQKIAPASQGPHIDLPMYIAQIDHFIDCVLLGKPPLCDGRQGLQNVRLMEAVHESARRGEAIHLLQNEAGPTRHLRS